MAVIRSKLLRMARGARSIADYLGIFPQRHHLIEQGVTEEQLRKAREWSPRQWQVIEGS